MPHVCWLCPLRCGTEHLQAARRLDIRRAHWPGSLARPRAVDASLSTANVVLGATRATGLSPTEMRLLHLLARGNRDEARLIYREVLAKGQVNPKVRAIAERAFGRTGEKSLERLAKKWDELYAGRSRVKGLEKQLEAAKGKRARDELK